MSGDNRGKKIRCSKCGASYYDFGKRSARCPKCQENELIPEGLIAPTQIKIWRGGYNDTSSGFTDGYATKAKSGAIYLKCSFEVLAGDNKGCKFTSTIRLASERGSQWWDDGRLILRDILNSANGISGKDTSLGARSYRKIETLGVFDGVEFVAEIGRVKGKDGIIRNELSSAITPDDPRHPSPFPSDEIKAAEKINISLDDTKPFEKSSFSPIWHSKV